MSEEARPLTGEERRLLLRVLACLQDSPEQQGSDEASPASGRALSTRLREINRWSSRQSGLR
ncbi:hypothetical protein [Streptomyces sp. SM1]|uniref:hypothetical protein n=1 Tax=Streptomyces sp. SM1 TaxID=402229 RepID=UPI000CD57713|nr:hypothetical protein [Streptomyces sp. SM1]